MVKYKENKLFKQLPAESQNFLLGIAEEFRFTFQEFRKVVEFERDLQMWDEPSVQSWWESRYGGKTGNKKSILANLESYIDDLKDLTCYIDTGVSPKPITKQDSTVHIKRSDKIIEGDCPVASEDTVCCNLKTIDAVENCGFGCSYCTIQTFYHQQINFDADLRKKLDQIKVDPDKYTHFGTGQSSDSLAWGNRNRILDDLCYFADLHPNILLELKTKSANMVYFRDHNIPENIVLTWSLNPQIVIDHEEHFTASLEQRLKAAKEASDLGIKIGFHFHPMMYYSGWEQDYKAIASYIIDNFDSSKVLFISFGTVTLIKPVIKKIRQLGNQTKILQMPFEKDPKGKYTYPDRFKIELFNLMIEAFSDWSKQVFFYLCMEKASIWNQTFGYAYPTNEDFERSFGRQMMKKIYS
ncbi:MAG: hypothetical protein GY786_05750 [Proteobacteria bacterium]|nr:hypothetical protein [Pseudomonadota bacterium]